MRLPTLWLVAVASLMASCGSDAGSAETTASTAPASLTAGLIAIGHSGLTGAGSDPTRPFEPVYENSWATGTNPEVRSIYQRMIEALPETEGNVANEAVGGSQALLLPQMARDALTEVPTPALVIVQTIDNDIRCDGSDPENIEFFGSRIRQALDVITATSPETQILIVSQVGRPARFAAAIAESPDAVAVHSGTGMCDLFDGDGQLVPDNIETLTGIIELYEAEQARVCAEVPQCHTDGGAFNTYVDEIDKVATDFNHGAVPGLAAAAELMWPTVAEILGAE